MVAQYAISTAGGALVGAIVGGVIEYWITDGRSGWGPLRVGVIGAVVGLGYTLVTTGLAESRGAAPPVRYTAAEIVESMDGMTSTQQEALLPRYTGEVIEEEGLVLDVRKGSWGRGHLLSLRVSSRTFVHGDSRDEAVGFLRRGEHVIFRGKVVGASDTGVVVQDLELLEVLPPEDPASREPEETTAPTEGPNYLAKAILADVEGLTGVQRDERIDALYQGRSVEFRGTVVDVVQTSWHGGDGESQDGFLVSLHQGDVSLFARSSADGAKHLRPGDRVHVRGILDSVTLGGLLLNDAEIVEVALN